MTDPNNETPEQDNPVDERIAATVEMYGQTLTRYHRAKSKRDKAALLAALEMLWVEMGKAGAIDQSNGEFKPEYQAYYDKGKAEG